MGASGVLVVGETPSLARTLVDLFDSDGIESRLVATVLAVDADSLSRVGVVVAASTGRSSSTLDALEAGRLVSQSVILVGSRDPRAVPGPRLHPIRLPLDAAGLLGLVRSLRR